jgi:hypothetical protein
MIKMFSSLDMSEPSSFGNRAGLRTKFWPSGRFQIDELANGHERTFLLAGKGGGTVVFVVGMGPLVVATASAVGVPEEHAKTAQDRQMR